MADTMDFRTKTEILSDLWLNYRDDEQFKDFVEYNDLGLPLAYALANGIVDVSPMAEQFVEETYRLLIASLGVEDVAYESLDDLFSNATDESE